MQAATTETITLGLLAVRLADRVDWVSVTTHGKRIKSETGFGRDAAGLVNRYYSAQMEWNEDVKVWQTDGWHMHDGKRVCISLKVRGGGKD